MISSHNREGHGSMRFTHQNISYFPHQRQRRACLLFTVENKACYWMGNSTVTIILSLPVLDSPQGLAHPSPSKSWSAWPLCALDLGACDPWFSRPYSLLGPRREKLDWRQLLELLNLSILMFNTIYLDEQCNLPWCAMQS